MADSAGAYRPRVGAGPEAPAGEGRGAARGTSRTAPHTAEYAGAVGAESLVIMCRCVWHGVPCQKEATQEDGLCDWCGTRRPEDMAGNEFFDERYGLAGGTVTGYNHQIGWPGIPDDVRPTACWMEAK